MAEFCMSGWRTIVAQYTAETRAKAGHYGGPVQTSQKLHSRKSKSVSEITGLQYNTCSYTQTSESQKMPYT